jgi:GT2 family glycosyltransferase
VARCEADPAIGLACPLVLEADDPGAIQSGCGLFDLETPDYMPTHDATQARDWQARLPERIALHGTALLVRRSLHQAIGGFDSEFFAYWEDVDYSIRSARAGFYNVIVMDAEVYHESKPTIVNSGSIKPYYYYLYSRNELLMWRKVCSGPKFIKAAAWNLQRQLRQIVRMPDNSAGIDAILAGLWHGWRGLGGRYDPTRRMPWPVRGMLRRHPKLWLRLLGEGQPSRRPDRPR